MSNDAGEANMKGYFEGEGPGLPHGDKVTAILDAVIVFSLKQPAPKKPGRTGNIVEQTPSKLILLPAFLRYNFRV